MNTLLKILLLVSTYHFAFTQNEKWRISGKVTDQNGSPIEFANVYINNTSIGTTTTAQGDFRLAIPNHYSEVNLVISFIGFKTLSRTIKISAENQVIIFKLESNILNELLVKGKTDPSWRKKWRKFEKALKGDSWFAKECKILNPEVISLEEANDKIIAKASEPIKIRNEALGYEIIFEMNKFETSENLTLFAGNKFFKKILPETDHQAQHFAQNRNEAYQNSTTNFFRALAQNELEKNHFEVYKMMKIKSTYYNATLKNDIADGSIVPTTAQEICEFDKEKQQYTLISNKPLLVFLMNKPNTNQPIYIDYPYQYSSISLPNNYLVFSSSGWLLKPNGVIIYEYWSKEGIANLLPQDYNLESTEDYPEAKNTAISRKNTLKLENLKLKGFKADSTTKIIEADITALNQNTLLKVRKQISSYTPDFTIKLTESDYNLTILDILQLRLPGFRVAHDNNSGKLQIGFSENFSLVAAAISNPDDLNPYDISPALVLNNIPYYGEDLVLQMLLSINVQNIETIEASRSNISALGIREGHGTIIIKTKK